MAGLLSASMALAQKGFKPVSGDAPAGTERRLALVVGNKDYQKLNPLRNPLNDANDMAAALKQLGFEVIQTTNADYRGFLNALNRFKDRLSTSDVALFYYSGHGLSYGGKNYLMPTDADITCMEQIEEYGISLNRILGDITAKGVKNSFILLDACRNVPNLKVCDNTKKEVSVNGGLAKPTNNPRGSMIVYATEEGSTADDNISEKNGLFTSALLKYLTHPDKGIRSILDQTTIEVEKRSNGGQSPGRYDKLQGDFVFMVTGETSVQYDHSNTKEPVKKVDLPPFIDMVYIPGGTFDMGNSFGDANKKPTHTVTVSNFMMSKHEVTVGQFALFIAETHYRTDAERVGSSRFFDYTRNKALDSTGINWRYGADLQQLSANRYDHPVVHVSHNDALEFCKWLSKKEGKTYRLPTEAEWEYAAGNGRTHSRYSWGDALRGERVTGNLKDQMAADAFKIMERHSGIMFLNYCDNYVFTAPVGSYKVNDLGLHDMTGNVSEWCADWYDADYYAHSSSSNPTGPKKGTFRVIRGGSWHTNPSNSEVTFRDYVAPSYRDTGVGFRIVSLQ